MKPGYKTTEFWLTLLAQILPILVLTGVLTTDEITAIQDTTAEAVKVIGSLAVSFVPLWRYIDGRSKIKAGG